VILKKIETEYEKDVKNIISGIIVLHCLDVPMKYISKEQR
jgi:hypothetical protein